MEYVDLVKFIISLVALAVIAFIILKKKKRLKLTGLNIGPFSTEITEKEVFVEKVEILSSPIAGCAGEVLSPPLKIQIRDVSGYPVKNKKVRLELFDESGLLSSKSYSGQTSKISNNNGVVIFDDLTPKKTGRICIFVCVDTLEERTEDIDILPPGLNLDFWNEPIGSEKYEEKLNRALRMSGGDKK